MAAGNKAQIEAVFGASGSGKGVYVKGKLRTLAPPRLFIWDLMDEYRDFAPRAVKLSTMARAAIGAKGGPIKIRYVPSGDKKSIDQQFALFCEIVFAAQRACVVVEELSAVTTPSYAPPPWARVCNMGRHRGLHVIGVSQYPAQVDKGLMGNATLIHTGVLRNVNHRKAVALEMDIDPDRIRDLAPLEWIERDMTTGEVKAGKVDIGAATATRSKRSARGAPGALRAPAAGLDSQT